MEANISNICPLAFAGTSGHIFLSAISTLMATHCTIFDDFRWPADNSQEIFNKKDISFDFIVIGAGSAGSVVASRLSNSNIGSVLLVEAGDDPGIDSEIPAFLFLNQNSHIDWHYKTLHSIDSCLGFVNESCIWSKGKGMGGSSSINAMIYVRGHPEDYENWEKAGNPGWGYKDLLKYFEAQENLFNLSSKFKGYENPWYNVIENAWQELGFKTHKYEGDESLIGTRKAKLVTKNGKRLNTAKVYLEKSEHLHTMKKTRVVKIIIDKKTHSATGIEIIHNNGRTMVVKCKNEIILSAGSVATPQILIQSGVGPKKYIESLGIQNILNLDVGKHLQDHILFPLFLKTNLNTELSMADINLSLLQYMLTRSGPFSTIGITDMTGFINTQNSTDCPDIQFHHTYFTKGDDFTLKPYLEGIGYKSEIIHAIRELNNEHDFLGIYPTLLHPKSQGRILLSKTEPREPVIKTNYLQHPDDMTSLLKAIDFVHTLERTSAFKNLDMEILHLNIPGCSSYLFDSEDYWRCYIRHMATTIYHPVGSAKMGPKSDESSVVSDKLLVHGMKNLRVIDASVMPTLPAGNTMASTLVVAQKGVEIILNDYKNKDEL